MSKVQSQLDSEMGVQSNENSDERSSDEDKITVLDWRRIAEEKQENEGWRKDGLFNELNKKQYPFITVRPGETSERKTEKESSIRRPVR